MQRRVPALYPVYWVHFTVLQKTPANHPVEQGIDPVRRGLIAILC